MARTTINDFQDAAEAIAQLLAKYSTVKDTETDAKWLKQGVRDQAVHVRNHLDVVSQMTREMPMERFDFEDFVSLGCRGLMLLQHAILKYPQEYQEWKEKAKQPLKRESCPTDD